MDKIILAKINQNILNKRKKEKWNKIDKIIYFSILIPSMFYIGVHLLLKII